MNSNLLLSSWAVQQHVGYYARSGRGSNLQVCHSKVSVLTIRICKVSGATDLVLSACVAVSPGERGASYYMIVLGSLVLQS